MAMSREQLAAARWDARRAWDYMRPFGALKGCNYVPAYCHSYIEMWRHYDEPTIRRELGYGRAAGLNTLRIFVGACQWQTMREKLYQHLDAFLTLAADMGYSVMLTLQPNLYVPPGFSPELDDPFILHFQPGRHDKGWTYEGAVFAPAAWPENRETVHAFVSDIVGRYARDRRVAFWDLYNEPWADCLEVVDEVFTAARAVDPDQPLTACWKAFDLSDVTSFHCYERPGEPYFAPDTRGPDWLTFEKELQRALDTGRPMLCTECLARTFGNELGAFLPAFAAHGIGFYVWGLCAGSAQYHFPWDWPLGAPEPKRWFHCLFYPDGAPFDERELALLRHYEYSL